MKSQQVQYPNMVLYGMDNGGTRIKTYPDKEFPSDESWSGGRDPKTYIWEVEVAVYSQVHSSNATRSANIYNGLDVTAGMWISDSIGNSLRIDTITMKSESLLNMTVTDVDRVNTFRDSSGRGGTGNGFFKTRQLIIFSLDDDNMPIIPFLPVEVKTPSLPSFISSRFQIWNPNRRYRIDKPDHGFTNNDVIVLNQETQQYEKSSNNNTKHPVIGTVIETYPNKFFISPINRIVSNTMPALCGNIGDYVYADPNTGKFTNTPSNNRLFIKLTESKKSHVTSIKDVGELTIGNKLKVNGIEYTVTSDIDTLVSEINQDTGTHFIKTVKKAGSTVSGNIKKQQAYGVVGAILPVSAKINGTIVNFTTDTSGSLTFGSGMADANDIVTDINNAGISGISATTTGVDTVTISNTLGGDIIIENVTNDGGGTPFAGVASCTGLPLETLSTGSTFRIYMERLDGGDITLESIIGNPIGDMGLFSVQNGQLPDGMIVENWNRVGETYVVDNMVARDNIFPIFTGDTVLVLDQGNGEWIKYMFVNGEYIVTATQDSARTDATTLSLTLTPDTVLKSKIGTVSDGSRITLVTVEVITPFDEDTILDIGDDYNDDSLLGDNYVDLGSKSIYQNNTAVVYNHGTDVDLFANFDSGISTVGEARILISYM